MTTNDFNDNDLDSLFGDDDDLFGESEQAAFPSDDLDDVFGEEFESEDLERTSFSVDDLESEFFDEGGEQDGGINRTFLFVGFLLIATFIVIVAAILLILSGGGGDDAAQQTAHFIETQNALVQTQGAETRIALEIASATSDVQTQTAVAIGSQTAIAGQTQTQEVINEAIYASETAIARNATNTIVALETSAALTATHLTPPPAPPVEYEVQILFNGTPLAAGVSVQVFRDDGDSQFDPPAPTITPTPLPSATPTPTSLPPSPTATASQSADTSPDASVEPGSDETAAAATRDAGIAAFDATATARAGGRPVQTEAPTSTSTPTPAPTEVAEANPADMLTQEAGDTAGTLSLMLPEGWLTADNLQTLGAFFFGDSLVAIESRSSVGPGISPQVAGLGGQISPQTMDEAITPELLDELLLIWLESVEEGGGTVVEEPADLEGDGLNGRYVIVEAGNERGYMAIIGGDDRVALVTATALATEFEANRDLLFAILQSVQLGTEDSGVAPASGGADEIGTEEPVGASINHAGRPAFRRSRPGSGGDGVFQDGPTPTPSDEDVAEGSFTIGEDGTFNLILPSEPGTYYLVMDLQPGDYTIFIENQEINFTVPEGSTLEQPIALTDRTVILVVTGIIATPTPTPSPTLTITVGTGTDPGELSAFFQTATAVAVVITPTPTPEGIPETGLFTQELDTTEELTLLALLGMGLIGVVVIVRRLRAAV